MLKCKNLLPPWPPRIPTCINVIVCNVYYNNAEMVSLHFLSLASPSMPTEMTQNILTSPHNHLDRNRLLSFILSAYCLSAWASGQHNHTLSCCKTLTYIKGMSSWCNIECGQSFVVIWLKQTETGNLCVCVFVDYSLCASSLCQARKWSKWQRVHITLWLSPLSVR